MVKMYHKYNNRLIFLIYIFNTQVGNNRHVFCSCCSRVRSCCCSTYCNTSCSTYCLLPSYPRYRPCYLHFRSSFLRPVLKILPATDRVSPIFQILPSYRLCPIFQILPVLPNPFYPKYLLLPSYVLPNHQLRQRPNRPTEK